MVCAEPHRPYDRPPLSKELLAGGARRPPRFRSASVWYAEQRIELCSASRDRAAHARRRLELADGRRFSYDRLLIATGEPAARCCPAPGRRQRLGPAHARRRRALRDALRARSAPGGDRRRVHRSGGRRHRAAARCEVTMIEAAPTRRWSGSSARSSGRGSRGLHRDEGVERAHRRTVTERRGQRHGAQRCTLSDGSRVAADHVLVGVGVRRLRSTGWRTAACADGGVPVDVTAARRRRTCSPPAMSPPP